MIRLLGPSLRTFCVECQASACIHVVVALDDAEATLAQQQARFDAMAKVLQGDTFVTKTMARPAR